MKRKNNKKGFTLIEILVVIVLIISILALTIISIVKISEKKKKDSYDLVVKQIVAASKNYLENNKYYLENLTNSNYINISLGKLIKEDYLNVVVNPITNKRFDKCNYVKVTKKDKDKLNYEFKSTEKDCSEKNFVKIGPSITLTIEEGKKGNYNWYKYNTKQTPGVIVKVTATDEIFGITSIEMKTNDGYKKMQMNPLDTKRGAYALDKSSFSKTTSSGKKVCYKVTNSKGLTNEDCINLKVDINRPNCELTVIGDMIDEKTYVYYASGSILFPVKLKLPEVVLSYSDIGSGISSKKISNDNNLTEDYYPSNKYTQDAKNNAYWEGTVKDYAGNVGWCGKTFNVKEQKIIEMVSRYYCGKKDGTSTVWTNQDRTITQEFKKTLSNEKQTITKTFNTTTKTSKISYNGVDCSVNVYVDKDKPVFDYISLTNNTVKLYQWDNYGNQILEKDVYLTKKDNGKYYGEACVLNKPGYFNVQGYNIMAKDEASGINGNSYETYWDYFSIRKNKQIGMQCLKTAGDNPCLMKQHVYVYDNAGNKSDDIGKIEIKIGYQGIDNFCK